jgi:endo-1,4-beta-xylanase
VRRAFFLLFSTMVLSAAFAQTSPSPEPSLKNAYKGTFFIGSAISRAQIYEEDARGVEIIKRQFDSITPENVLKWALVHPKPDAYDFGAADKYVEFGEKNNMKREIR